MSTRTRFPAGTGPSFCAGAWRTSQTSDMRTRPAVVLASGMAVLALAVATVALAWTPANPGATRAADGSVAAATAHGQAVRRTPRPTATPRPTPKPTPKPKPTPTPTPTATPAPGGTGPTLGGCPVLPAGNVWNQPVNALPVRADSATMIAAIGATSGLHPDFSNAGGYGIPFNVVGAATPRSAVTFYYPDESDAVGYPIPQSPLIEGGSDRHILMVDTDACRLYELYDASQAAGAWNAGSGATWDLRSNALRPATWTSADAAGLPIFPGLVRYDEVAAGVIRHAIRFTAPSTCAGYIYPARHQAGSGSCAVKPPMGLRLRLKASVNISGFGAQAQVILTALKTYGMLLADNGSPFYITGVPDSRWDDAVLHALGQIKGSDFEVVDTSGLVNT
jgi:hypothetical protein